MFIQKVGINGEFQNTKELIVERNVSTGEPNGIVRGATNHLKLHAQEPGASFQERDKRLIELLKDYNSVGITAAIDRAVSREDIEQYRRLNEGKQLTVRFGLSYRIDATRSRELISDEIHDLTVDPLFSGDEFLRIIGVKTFLDGGMLTGSAYMREPWGVSSIYGINDATYRGVRYIDAETLSPLVGLAVDNDLQFTAHCVGDGAVHALLDAYELVSKSTPKVASTHSCVTHSNFMSKEAIDKAAELGVCLDIQPAWLYLDTRTLVSQFGYDRLRYFQPLKSVFAASVIAGGGSDHMQKIGSLRSINPYNPFLGMWTSIARSARWYESRLHPEEALSRQQAIRLYTWNSAYVLRREHELGSVELGKMADFIIIDQDLLACPLDAIKDTKVLATYLGGVKVYEPSVHRD
jgi:predicted amidohydrolase YtcJ